MRIQPDWEPGALLQAQILGRESRAKALEYLGSSLPPIPAPRMCGSATRAS